MKLLPVILTLLLAACSKKEGLPDEIKLTIEPSGEVVITLDDQRGVTVRQSRTDGKAAIVANLDGKLQVLQLEPGGDTPRSLDLLDEDRARFSVWKDIDGASTLIIDDDGDGLPDIKIVGKQGFRVAEIQWEEIRESSWPEADATGHDAVKALFSRARDARLAGYAGQWTGTEDLIRDLEAGVRIESEGLDVPVIFKVEPLTPEERELALQNISIEKGMPSWSER